MPIERRSDPSNYGPEYFEAKSYRESMTLPRTVLGRNEPPLAHTLAEMITSIHPAPARVLDVGAAFGFVVKELLGRGYDAWGIDLSPDCVRQSEVADRLRIGDASDAASYDGLGRFDLTVAANLFEHLHSEEAEAVATHLAAQTEYLLAIINKSDHDPTHVSLKSNTFWKKLFRASGWRFQRSATARARSTYLKYSQGTERWHRDTLVFSRAGARPIRDAAALIEYPGREAARLALRIAERSPFPPATGR